MRGGSLGVFAVVGIRRVWACRFLDSFAMGWLWMFDGVMFGMCFQKMAFLRGSLMSVARIWGGGLSVLGLLYDWRSGVSACLA